MDEITLTGLLAIYELKIDSYQPSVIASMILDT